MDNITKKKTISSVATIARCIDFIREVQFKEYGLSRGQYMFLTRVYENPGFIQKELSYKLKIDKSSTTKAIKKLEEKKLVIRERSDDDKRKLELYPTDKLKKLYPKLQEKILATYNKGFANFSDEELEILLSLIKKLEKNINKEWQEIKQKSQ